MLWGGGSQGESFMLTNGMVPASFGSYPKNKKPPPPDDGGGRAAGGGETNSLDGEVLEL